MCQCPYSGALHFYRLLKRTMRRRKDCVNALTRALSISTVPLKMVIEIKAFWALFCRYFSEYSEKYLFSLFFWLFTVCS